MTAAAEPTTLDQLADDFWNEALEHHPTFATAIGDRRFDDRIEDESPAALDAWRGRLDVFDRQLAELGDDADPVTRAALEDALIVERFVMDADLVAFNVDPMNGPQVDLLNIPSYQPIRSAAEADALLARWAAMPGYLDTAIENLRRGAGEGRLGVATLCIKVTEQLDELLARPDADWPLMEPAEQAPEIRDQLLAVIGQEIRPAFERYRATVADELAPHARPDDQPGLSHLPGGPEAYAKLARAYTSLEVDPEEVHAIGLEEIRRIDGEFVELGSSPARHQGPERHARGPAQ